MDSALNDEWVGYNIHDCHKIVMKRAVNGWVFSFTDNDGNTIETYISNDIERALSNIGTIVRANLDNVDWGSDQ